MIEFKFSCPNCGQHIQCNDAYSGMQIICPTCKNQILVPQAPGSVPLKAAPVTPAPPAVDSLAPSQARPSPSLKGGKKSKTKLVVLCAAVGLIFLGVIAYAFVSIVLSPSEKATEVAVAKPASEKTTTRKTVEPVSAINAKVSSDPQTSRAVRNSDNSGTPTAAEIVRQVMENYETMTSYSAKGKAVSIIDMSAVDHSNIPGGNAEEIKRTLNKPQKMESDFSIKLGKPDFYRVEWEGLMGSLRRKGAVWSSGDGDFLLMEMGQTKYAKMKNREMALASATGLSGGVANTMPEIFFQGQSSLLNLFKNARRDADESIEGEDCYVVTGNAMGLKVLLWINKSTYLIKQKQQVLGGQLEIPEMSEANMEEGLKQLGGNPTDKQKAQMKEAMKNMKALSSQMKGTMTETYEDIEINQPLTKTDFKYEVPSGTKLSDSLF